MTDKQFNSLFHRAQMIMDESRDTAHGWLHIERVLANIEGIKNLLALSVQKRLDDDLLRLCAAWHDVSYAYYNVSILHYFLEGQRASRIVRREFRKKGVSRKEIRLVAGVVARHPFNDLWFINKAINKKRSLYHKLLQDADWLDEFDSKRLEKLEMKTKSSKYWWFMIKIAKPLMFPFMKKNKKKFLHLKESLKYAESLDI